MDLIGIIFFAIIDFLKLAIPLTIISFVLYKLFYPLKEKLVEKYEFSWIKSVFLINFVLTFLFLFFIYIYFYLTGIIQERPLDYELSHTIFEIISFILIDSIRILIASFIIALVLLGLAFVFGIIIDLLENKEFSKTIKEIIALFVTCSLFLFLVLFVFNWALIGFFIFIFFGGVSQFPLL